MTMYFILKSQKVPVAALTDKDTQRKDLQNAINDFITLYN